MSAVSCAVASVAPGCASSFALGSSRHQSTRQRSVFATPFQGTVRSHDHQQCSTGKEGPWVTSTLTVAAAAISARQAITSSNRRRHRGQFRVVESFVLAAAAETSVSREEASIADLEIRETVATESESRENFNWTQAWYPLSPIGYLDEKKPNPLTILGRRIVVWKSEGEDSTWHAVEDSCPHRMVPLSLGAVKADGSLQCRYHGWCFNGDGKCVEVPMAPDAEIKAKMCSLARSAVASFPVQVRQGLLWVFPDATEAGKLAAAATEPYTVPECDGVEWVMTVAPVGYDVSVENTFDPSHAPFLHEGIIKYAPERAVPMTNFTLQGGKISAKDGFVLEHSGYDENTRGMEATRNFTPPSCNTATYKYADGRVQTSQLYFVPCSPRETRYILNLPSVTGKKRKGRLASFMGDVLHAVFFNKVFGYRFQEQDLSAMRGQEQIMSDQSGRQWGEQYVLGTPSDVGVEAFRNWYYKEAGGGPAWRMQERHSNAQTPHPTAPATDSALYDRWERHAKHCPKCRRVLRALGRLEVAASWLTMAGVAAGTAGGALGRPCAATIGVCGAIAAQGLQRWAKAEQWGFISSVPQTGAPTPKVYKEVA